MNIFDRVIEDNRIKSMFMILLKLLIQFILTYNVSNKTYLNKLFPTILKQ